MATVLMTKATPRMVQNESMGIDTSDLTGRERDFVEAILCVWGTRQPTLEQMCAAIDFVWYAMGGNKWSPDPDMLACYYRHPIWVLNGLFIEQHALSIEYREEFSDWVREQRPSRVGDFGGGFGTLARMVAAKCPETEVHVVEPFPHEQALARLAAFPRASYRSELSGLYDLVIATDVFEHISDPLALVNAVSAHIPIGGKFLIANHFAPLIACHLPPTFHFRSTWHFFMSMLGYQAERPVSYGWSYLKIREPANLAVVRKWEQVSRSIFRFTEKIPRLERLVDRLSIKWARMAFHQRWLR
jgi:Methyltransferase domain